MRRWAIVLALLGLPAITEAFATDTMPASGTYVVNDDDVNVRAAPDVRTGQVIGRLNRGAVVEVVEMTRLTFTVGEITAAWFHIKSPDGWIFGWYLDPTG